MASSPSGPPSRLAYANPTWGMSRDERWLQDIVSSQRMSLEPTLTLHPRNQRLTEEEMLGGKMFSRSVPSPSSLSARTVSPTGKMDTLCSVVRSGTTQAVYKHLHESCVDINDEERTESGKACTPLSEAIRTRNHCTARLLLDFEADPTQGLSDSPTTTAVSLAATSADSERLLYPKLHGPHTPGFTIFLRTHLPSFRVLRRRSHLDGGPQGELLEERAGEEGGSLLDHHIVDQGYPGNPAPAAGEEACVGNGNLLVSARQEPNETRRGNLSAIPPNSLSHLVPDISLSQSPLSQPLSSFLVGPLSPIGLPALSQSPFVGHLFLSETFRLLPLLRDGTSSNGGDEDGHAGGAAPIWLAHTNRPVGHWVILAVYVVTQFCSSAASGHGDPTVPSARNLLPGCLPAGGERTRVRPLRKGPASEPRAAAK
jgi:hypothetical protein